MIIIVLLSNEKIQKEKGKKYCLPKKRNKT